MVGFTNAALGTDFRGWCGEGQSWSRNIGSATFFVEATLAGGLGGGAAAEASAASETTYLYQKLSSTGQHLKYGITKNPATRYTSAEMNGGRLKILTSGAKKDMLALERSLHEWLPIGLEEGQLFCIAKQVANGLRPPPY